jgi:hypothetical protein
VSGFAKATRIPLQEGNYAGPKHQPAEDRRNRPENGRTMNTTTSTQSSAPSTPPTGDDRNIESRLMKVTVFASLIVIVAFCAVFIR